MSRKMKFLAPVLAVVLIGQASYAAACGCVTILTPAAANVAFAATSVTTATNAQKIATGVLIANMTAGFGILWSKLDSINNQIAASGLAIESKVTELNEALRAAAQIAAENRKAELTSDFDNEVEQKYGLDNQPEALCSSEVMAGAYQAALLSNAALLLEMGKVARSREDDGRFKNTQEALDDLLAELKNRPSPEEIADKLGLNRSVTNISPQDAGKLLTILNNIYNAIPTRKLTEDEANTSNGQEYESARQAFLAKKEFYQGVINKYIADRTTTVDGLSDWARDKWTAMGANLSSLPENILSKDGKMSLDSLRYLLSNYRIGSINYFTKELPKLQEEGLLRDIAASQAVSLELERKEVELLDSLTMMLAFDGLQTLNLEDSPQLDALYSQIFVSESHNSQ